MNNPKISVVMPNYNGGAFLSEAIESILNQTFKDFEFIIIDDGSSDNSWEIIQKYSKIDFRIVALKNERNLKICQTLNRGIAKARGEFIARMDSDDISLPTRLEKQFKFLSKVDNCDIGIVGTNFILIDDNSLEIGKKNYPCDDTECKNAFWFRNPHGHSSVLIRKKCFDEFGNYDDNFIYAEDLDLWMRFGQKYKLHNLQEYLLKYRISGINSTLKKQKRMIESTLKARNKAQNKYGYSISFRGRISTITTWLAQFFPPVLVLKIFNFFKS